MNGSVPWEVHRAGAVAGAELPPEVRELTRGRPGFQFMPRPYSEST
ncbi:hypothetical protein HCC61_12915 [Streptomyces sp. HNM0575]|nr:hypothetical protein [Streptomyces sp. HNM0575]NLU73569.1 hypothetical protein [Streptomyces sp. HNM0575]